MISCIIIIIHMIYKYVLNNIILYFTILCIVAILYCSNKILYYIYYIILYYTVLYYIILYYTVLYYIIL